MTHGAPADRYGTNLAMWTKDAMTFWHFLNGSFTSRHTDYDCDNQPSMRHLTAEMAPAGHLDTALASEGFDTICSNHVDHAFAFSPPY